MPAAGPGHRTDAPQPRDGRGHTEANEALHPNIDFMTERSPVSILERQQRLEAAISEALHREAVRHEAAVKNMHRLRALRLERAGNKPVVKGETLPIVAPNGPSPINDPPPPIDDPPKPREPDEPHKQPPVNDPPPEEKPPPMRAAEDSARQRGRRRDL